MLRVLKYLKNKKCKLFWHRWTIEDINEKTYTKKCKDCKQEVEKINTTIVVVDHGT
jgi:hypothetical protein